MDKIKAKVAETKAAVSSNKDPNANTNPHSTNAGSHDSNLANKADPRIDSDRDGSRNAGAASHNTGYGTTGTTGATGTTGGFNNSSTNAGPHNSNLANKADPRVDSDLDGSRNAGAAGHSSSGYGTTGNTSSNYGPHSSNVANKADPRVDSDLDGSRNFGATSGTGHSAGYGSGATTGTTGTSGTGANHQESARSTNHGPHNSNVLNKADPRVDSDRDGSRNMGAASQGTGAHNPSLASANTSSSAGYGGASGVQGSHTGPAPNTAGPHKSDMLNKVDPRVDSDLDSHQNRKLDVGTGSTGTTGTTGGIHHGGATTGGYGTSANQSENYRSGNHGPHDSNLANKADPRVDSDLDGSRSGGAVRGHGQSTTGY